MTDGEVAHDYSSGYILLHPVIIKVRTRMELALEVFIGRSRVIRPDQWRVAEPSGTDI